MKLGILKTDDVRPEWVDEFGEYSDMFIELLTGVNPDLETKVYEVQRGDYPSDIDEVDAYLMTGSKASVYDDTPWVKQLAEFVQRLHAAKKKLVGICFGHQMVAHALGGTTKKSDKGWGVGRATVQLNSQGMELLQNLSEQPANDNAYSIIVSHQDQVLEPAKGAKVLAGNDFCPNAMCQLDQHILTFQGHPEFAPEYSQELLTFRREKIGEAVYQKGIESLQLPLDRQRVAGWIMSFLEG